jgi:hypothetical protein
MGAPAAAQPLAQHGQQAQAIQIVHQAVKLLSQALPMLGVGSDIQKAVTSAIGGLSRHAGATDGAEALQKSTVADLGQQAQSSAALMALLRARGGAGGPGGGMGAPSPEGA